MPSNLGDLGDKRICMVASFVPSVGGISGQAELLSDNLEKGGAKVFRVKTKTKTPLKLTAFLKMLKISKNCDVIHVHCSSYWGFLPVIMADITKRLFSRRVVITYHGGLLEKFLEKWGFLIIPFLKNVDRIIVPSEFLRKKFSGFGLSATVIPNILDLSQFKYIRREKIQPKLLVVKHLEEIYNIKMGITAFKIVKEAFPESKLMIVGTGSQEEKLKALVNELYLEDVIFLGEIKHKEIATIYSKADILLNCSKVESFGMVILEAAASGLPIVSTNVGGIPYLIEDRKNGFLVESNDHVKMAEKVIYLLKNQEEALKIARNGRKLSETHTWNSISSKLMEAYFT